MTGQSSSSTGFIPAGSGCGRTRATAWCSHSGPRSWRPAPDRYTIGLQDRFAEFAHQLGERFGWEAIVFEAKVNPERPPREDLQEDVAEIVRAYNWLDVELYSRAAAAAAVAGSRELA